VTIVAGAEPVSLGSGGRAVLVLHGFGDTPQSVRSLAHQLHAGGWTVRVPLLQGHGGSLRDLMHGRARHWLADARFALAELQRDASSVTIVGQSMGGALATILAVEARVAAMVLLAPFLRLPPRAARIATFHWFVSPFVRTIRSRTEQSILDPEARRRALGRGITSPRLLHELSIIVRQARKASPMVTTPTLVIHSRQDPRVDVADAEHAFTRLGTTRKKLVWAERSGHVLTVDFDRDWVAGHVISWLDEHMPEHD
jgi:carboxylesterase